MKRPLYSAKEFVRYALKIGALKLIPELLELNSGRMSPYFFNMGSFDTGSALEKLSFAYLCAALNLPFDVVYGPAYKGISLAALIAVRYWQTQRMSVGYAYNRKEPKKTAKEEFSPDARSKRNAFLSSMMS